MKIRSIKMPEKEFKRVMAAADMSGESFNGFVRRVVHQKAMKLFIERHPKILENIVGDSFDNYVMTLEKIGGKAVER